MIFKLFNRNENSFDTLQQLSNIVYEERSTDEITFSCLCHKIKNIYEKTSDLDQSLVRSDLYSIIFWNDFERSVRIKSLQTLIDLESRTHIVLALHSQYYLYEGARKGVSWALDYLDEPPYTHVKIYKRKIFPF